jgi:2-keto-myo-inositol isomerase
MKVEQLTINSQCTFHWNLEEALDAYAAAGFRYVEPYLPLVKAWMEDGHTVEQTRELFGSRDLRLVASSELAVECFHASDVLLPNLRANAENARLIAELGGSAMIVHTDGPEQVTPASLDPIARALVDLATATEDVDIVVEFNASPVVKSLGSGLRR